MTNKRTMLGLCLTAALMGCSPTPQQAEANKQTTGNPTASAALIAVVDGCRLWFVNWERTHIYFTRCEGRTSNTQWTYKSGKQSRTAQTVGGYDDQ